jgi:hypothetical protein
MDEKSSIKHDNISFDLALDFNTMSRAKLILQANVEKG